MSSSTSSIFNLLPQLPISLTIADQIYVAVLSIYLFVSLVSSPENNKARPATPSMHAITLLELPPMKSSAGARAEGKLIQMVSEKKKGGRTKHRKRKRRAPKLKATMWASRIPRLRC